VTTGRIYNLASGITAWYGETLRDFPKVSVFDAAALPEDLLYKAMDLEKAAWRFYRSVTNQISESKVIQAFATLGQAETAHARAVYGIWKTVRNDAAPAFEEVFDALAGEILEGGRELASVVGELAAANTGSCLELIELALAIEVAAFDLYRVMAERVNDTTVRETFLTLAQSEKAHMRVLSQAVAACADE
jgi:rubrerythrin